MKREKIRFIVDEQKDIKRFNSKIRKINYIDVDNQKIIFLSEKLENISNIEYTELKKVKLSMCSRMSRWGSSDVNVDLDLVLENRIISYEIILPYSLDILIRYLTINNIPIEDCAEVLKIYEMFTDADKRCTYLRTNFNKYAKKYHLDHPRIG